MVSLAGHAYAKKPFAFGYRQEYMPACAALLTRNRIPLASLGGKSGTGRIAGGGISVPIPTLRPAPEDPETLANLAGGLVIEQRPRNAIEAADVRTLGPSYYYQERPVIVFAKGKWTPQLSPLDMIVVGTAEAAEPGQQPTAPQP